jgi:hypothetical protein
MVLREGPGDSVLCIGQASHGWLAGQLARAWGNERFGSFPRREEVCLGAEQHDVGWVDWDLAPGLNAKTGQPLEFHQLARAAHVAIWEGAPLRLVTQSLYAALLCSRHATLLYERWVDPSTFTAEERALVDEYLIAARARQQSFAAAAHVSTEEAEHASGLIAAWDDMSLTLCHAKPGTIRQVPIPGGESTALLIEQADQLTRPGPWSHAWSVDPWPFMDDAVEVHCEGRLLAGRFTDERSLHAALARAEVLSVSSLLTRKR